MLFDGVYSVVMVENQFTDPDTTREDWVDVRMEDPEEGEWDVDAVVVGGQVEYIDLRIRPELLSEFIECLIDDVGDEEASAILSNVADSKAIDLQDGPDAAE